ncbi:hypothetical protein FisN_2Hh056 [Fistulifera solaris]|jgi:hypothetical protein|uniref:Uncharacterized protein n=1 Tax=Fistulifera solaris TaxID=1519565 RepID=A0A1Z5KEA0_FISSO|nr:hypothetical protein FisN_2Hh056 [Fistulifera solaris]|eukprot:GAX24455.1 hypothetical protein FisN_2Hh056 [Fistulifera solaris]
MKFAFPSFLLFVSIAPTQAGPLCDGLMSQAITAIDPPFPFECECGLRLLRRPRFDCATEVCISDVDGLFGGLLPVELPIIYAESTCLNPTFKGRFPKRANGNVEIGGCTGQALMVVDAEQLVDAIDSSGQYDAADVDLPPKLDFNIPNSCLDVTSSSRPSLRDRTISVSGCSASIGGESCPCTPCGGGTGVEIGAECVTKLFNKMIPESLSTNENQEIKDAFTFTASDPICVSTENLRTGRGVVDVMLKPYLTQL